MNKRYIVQNDVVATGNEGHFCVGGDGFGFERSLRRNLDGDEDLIETADSGVGHNESRSFGIGRMMVRGLSFA